MATNFTIKFKIDSENVRSVAKEIATELRSMTDFKLVSLGWRIQELPSNDTLSCGNLFTDKARAIDALRAWRKTELCQRGEVKYRLIHVKGSPYSNPLAGTYVEYSSDDDGGLVASIRRYAA